MKETHNDHGVQFRVVDGKRSSQSVGKDVFAEAASVVDASLADRIRRRQDWRKNYLQPVRELVEAGVRSGKDARRMAIEGLNAVCENFVFSRNGDEMPLTQALETHYNGAFTTAEVRGEGERPAELVIPYRGKDLRGDDLHRRLESWERGGIIEPSTAAAVRLVAAHPEWLDLSDRRFVLLGAASEMGPLEWLCRWGATVVAVDLPRPDLWHRIINVARKGSGSLHAPVRSAVSRDRDDLAERAGADLLTESPEIYEWISSFDGPLVIGNYAYADGSTFLRLAAVLDTLIAGIQQRRTDASISYLATPTDVFAVPEAIPESVTKRSGRLASLSSTAT